MSLAKRVGKKGLSDVVTTVLIILMTVAAIGLIWAFVIPMVRDNLANASVNKQIDLTIKTAGGESCVDYNKGILVVNVFKGEEDYEVSKLKFIVISEGSSISFVENKGLKKQTAQFNELLIKVLCHNICVVIQEINELGVKAEFSLEQTREISV